MKLSEAMVAGAAFTKPLRNGFSRGGKRGGQVYACAIGAACYRASDLTPLEGEILDGYEWASYAIFVFPQLLDEVTYTFGSGYQRGTTWRGPLLALITDLVDRYDFSRDRAIAAVKQLGY